MRSMTKNERQKMGPTDRAAIVAKSGEKGRRRNVCGSVTDSLYKSVGSGIHNMMDSIVSRIIYKPKHKFHQKMQDGDLNESISLSEDPKHGNKLANMGNKIGEN